MAAAPDLRLTTSLFDRMKPIDVDTHITEPPTVWTDRVAKKWGDQVPHIKHIDGRDLWVVGDQMIGGPGFTTAAGFEGSYPEFRNGYHDIPKSSWDAKARLDYMDEEGICGAILYPNVGGFGSGGFLKLKDPAADARMRARLQRLPRRLVQRVAGSPRRRSRRCRSGT